jgi:hypothetical protein
MFTLSFLSTARRRRRRAPGPHRDHCHGIVVVQPVSYNPKLSRICVLHARAPARSPMDVGGTSTSVAGAASIRSVHQLGSF